MTKILLSLTFIIISNIIIAQDFFAKSESFFAQHVSNGLVDYDAILDNPDDMDDLVKIIANADIESMKDQERKAFLINAYNISVIKGLVDSWPIDNPLNIEGFFEKEKHNIGGEKITLNEIENEKLRPIYNDARLHFVLVCGAISCPKIASFAYTPENLEAMLEERTKLALNNDEFIQVNDGKKIVKISEIFFWYSEDFKSEGQDYISFINQYRAKPIGADYVVDKYTYDWSVNKK